MFVCVWVAVVSNVAVCTWLVLVFDLRHFGVSMEE